MTFGKLLKNARKAKGWTLATVASHIGVTIAYLSDVENGRRDPFRPNRIPQLASALNIDEETLHVMAARERGGELRLDVTGLDVVQLSSLVALYVDMRGAKVQP